MTHYLEKRSMKINGHRTSIALEPEFWRVTEDMARLKGQSVSGFVASVDAKKAQGQSLASAVRCAALAAAGKVQGLAA